MINTTGNIGDFNSLIRQESSDVLYGVFLAGSHVPDQVECRMMSLMAASAASPLERIYLAFDAHRAIHAADRCDDALETGRHLAFTGLLSEDEMLPVFDRPFKDLDIDLLELVTMPLRPGEFERKAVCAILKHRADAAGMLL
ncbi:hypothetical protein CSQ85_11705 [Bifidobacterium rousetti]|uniref:hypothetical protein n=1 Tax=Bifidobacterium rousetti TaxID=2045439 RepID=UPI000D142AD5|nr:hypothetical protein [Bifidobacterium rousetti]KAA8816765.1 hypothetical protein CSQ85_11705 [Bifidobacterium rousetti]PST49374.1 hypothetical protein COO72_02650 [Bifidobacterium callitrichos]